MRARVHQRTSPYISVLHIVAVCTQAYGVFFIITVIYIINCVWYARLLRQMRLLRTRLIRTFPHTVITLPRLLRNARLLR